ncbi:MAG: hypothetical protein ACI4MS_04505 [Candidatus Coproplasma sp.]
MRDGRNVSYGRRGNLRVLSDLKNRVPAKDLLAKILWEEERQRSKVCLDEIGKVAYTECMTEEFDVSKNNYLS